MTAQRKKYCLIFIALCYCFMTTNSQNRRRYFTGDNTSETEFNKIAKSAKRASRDLDNLPDAVSLKIYTPEPQDQGKHGTCVAWSTSYAARTISYCIQHQIKDPIQIKSVTFSPAYLYYYIKPAGDDSCAAGSRIEPALKVLSDKGDALLSDNIPDCAGNMDNAITNKAKDYTIKAYTSLSNAFGRIDKNDLISIRKSISENKPVIFSLKCLSSLFNVGKDGVWNPSPNDTIVGNHAVCIVGYDNKRLNGSFEVMNSWGKDWGNGGFFWLTDDQMKQYGSYALELMDKESYDPKITRSLGDPQIKGSLDFVLADEFGNDLSAMPVQLAVLSANSNIKFSNYSLTKAYSDQTKFKIKFTSNAPAFVYIFSVDDNNQVSPMFPYADNISPAVNSTNATIYLPSETKHFTLNADARKEKICVLFGKSPVDFNELRAAIGRTTAGLVSPILSLYGQRIIPLDRINYKDDSIGFGSKAGENEIICFFIDLNHQ